MTMKNKLFKHHKSKFGICVKKASVAIGCFCGALGMVALPTYISITNANEAPSLAQVQKVENPLTKICEFYKITIKLKVTPR